MVRVNGMRLERFVKDSGSRGGQRKALAELERKALRETVTAAAAVSIGAVPVGEVGARLVVAAVPGAHTDCEAALSAALERPVALLRFDEDLVREAISRHYPAPGGEGAGVDLPTFETPGFLRDARAAKALLSEKGGALQEDEIRLPADRLAFVDVRVHSILRSLDVKRRIEFTPTKSMLAFRLEREAEGADDHRALLFRDKLPSDEVRAIVSQGLFYDGDEHVQAVVSADLTKLPHVIHPSELQLAGLETDEARFWVYDRIETVRAGGPGPRPVASWTLTYYFLHYGARFERTLRLDVLAFALVERSKVRLAGKNEGLSPCELERVFGLDFGREAGRLENAP